MLKILKKEQLLCGGFFDVDVKEERLQEITRELEQPNIWNNPEKAQLLAKERVSLQKVTEEMVKLQRRVADAEEWLDLLTTERDEHLLVELNNEVKELTKILAELEFQRMFSGEMDSNNAFLEVQSGSGGTEAQDWANMLLRMYLRWAEQKGFQTEILDYSSGEVAGIKGATVKIIGSYAYGWLRSETGIHRLVRKSPFDSGNRRHTSFAAIFVSPEIDESINIEINPADLRIDTYRASGAGGQHVNRTDSAVRITHIPTNTVVQCQSERSQHQNKAHAMNRLRAKLYEMELQKKRASQQTLEDNKADIGWGNQIRSYVLDDSYVVDLRTRYRTGNPQAVLDGDLDSFIQETLKQGL